MSLLALASTITHLILSLHRKEQNSHQYICLVPRKYLLFVFLSGWVLKDHKIKVKIKHVNPRKHTEGTKIQVCVDARTNLSEGGYK